MAAGVGALRRPACRRPGAPPVQALPAAKVLQALFSSATDQGSAGTGDLGVSLLQQRQKAEERPDAVVVVVSADEQPAPSTAEKLRGLISQAASSLELPNAYHKVRVGRFRQWVQPVPVPYHRHRARPLILVHPPRCCRGLMPVDPPLQGQSHPVFAGLRSLARHFDIKVLGTCMPGAPTAAPATREALREHAVRQPEGPPVVVVACPESAQEEEALLDEAQAHLDSWTEHHVIVHACRGGRHGGAAKERQQAAGQQQGQHGGRNLLQSTAAMAAYFTSSAANRTQNYTYCDPVCQKHVSARAGRQGAGLAGLQARGQGSAGCWV